MAWDSTRPVPWQRLVREWLIYVAIMLAIVLIFMRDRSLVGIIAGLLISGPMYLVLGYVLAKFGYTRKSLRQLRADAPARTSGGSKRSSDDSGADGSPGPRPKPAPTSRTGGASQRPGGARQAPRKRKR